MDTRSSGRRAAAPRTRSTWALLLLLLLLSAAPSGLASADYAGRVAIADVPVPGATVTAARDGRTVKTITDQDGAYLFSGLEDGVWTITVEMIGFQTLTFTVTIPPPADGAAAPSELTLLPLDRIVANIPEPRPDAATTAAGPGSDGSAAPPQATSAAASGQSGFQRAGVQQVAPPPATPASFPDDAPADPTGMGAAAGLLINGSVNNGASTPFAQARAFGTNRPNQRSLYNGAAGIQLGNGAWDARPYSLIGERPPRPSYTDAQFLGTFQGPFRIPRVRNQLNVMIGYQGTSDHNTVTQSARMPTALERAGDFSQSLTAGGRPVVVLDPRTGLPFPGNVIPADRISPQAAALLGYYPLPSSDQIGRNNFQAPILTGNRQDAVQSRFVQSPNNRNQLGATINYQRGTTDTTTLFGFEDARENSGLDAQMNWSFRWSQFMTMRARYQYTRQANTTIPHFSGTTNVSGEAGIGGNDQTAVNWGPPTLVFGTNVAGLSDASYASSRIATHSWSGEGLSFRGRHTITLGGDVRRHYIDLVGQQDPRGTLAFTGAASGSDFADFLLGLPTTTSIAFGNPDKYFRHNSYAAYITDDWRLSPSLTLNLGVRWEYEAPIAERFGRLVNLDIAPGFTAVAPVVANAPAGIVTGRDYPSSLLHPDRSGVQPRLGLAWRPIAGSSVVIRAGYGIYRNTNVYQSIATMLAQQPPLSTTFSLASDPSNPITLADPFFAGTVPAGAINTFAIDPFFRVGFAQNWQASLQRDLPHSLTMVATYLGAKGSRLMQQFLPNTYPAGGENPCAECPAGFRYLTSGGRSIRNAAQIEVRRRLRNGFSASATYTLAKAMDNAASFGGASLEAVALAQDWRDLEAEYARSNFDQRHKLVVQAEYTTGAGITGGTLMDGVKGRLFKDWTFTAQLTTGSGMPVTPLFFSPVGGTGIIGGTRPSLTGAPLDEAPDGYYVNPLAFAVPEPGTWGNAARNSITGPSQFSLNASVSRTFRIGDRLNLDWRIDAFNVLNRVTYATIDTLVTSPEFGLPNRTNDMRRLRSSVRVRF